MPPKQHRNFTNAELSGVRPETCSRLDIARDISKVPYRLSCTTGGKHVADSAHYTGEAVDISHGGDPILAARIAYGLGVAGFVRVGFYDKHIHADTSLRLPQTQWEGKSQ